MTRALIELCTRYSNSTSKVINTVGRNFFWWRDLVIIGSKVIFELLIRHLLEEEESLKDIDSQVEGNNFKRNIHRNIRSISPIYSAVVVSRNSGKSTGERTMDQMGKALCMLC
jgi:hypothetical protein